MILKAFWLSFFIFWKLSISRSEIILNGENSNEFQKYIKNLVRQWDEIDPGIHDIYYIGVNFTDFGEGFLKENLENAVFNFNLDSIKRKVQVKPGSLVILQTSAKKIASLRLQSKLKFWEISSKYIWVPTTPLTDIQFQRVSNFFKAHGVLDFVAITDESEVFTHNPFFNKTVIFPGRSKKEFREIFEDKLKDLNSYEFKILAIEQPGRLGTKNGKLTGLYPFFFDIFREKLNATYTIKHQKSFFEVNFDWDGAMALFGENDYDLHFNSFLKRTKTNSEPVILYDPLTFCLGAPRSTIKNSFEYFFVEPFSLAVWVLILLAIGFSSSIWGFIYYKKLSKSPDSPMRFIFGMIGFFLGQDIGFRKLCLLQTCLVQLFVLGFFCLSNLYTSDLISLRTVPREVREINSIADLKRTGMKIRSSSNLYDTLAESNYDPELLRLMVREPTALKFRSVGPNHEAFLVRCDVLEYILTTHIVFPNLTDSYYILDEKLSLNFNYLSYNRLNPYRERLQYYITLIFEAALQHRYELTDGMKSSGMAEDEAQKQISYITFDNLRLTFWIYLGGCFLAFIVFIGEIVCNLICKRCRKNKISFY
jgi:hypothetical protein